MTDLVPIRRALLSVSDKEDLTELGAALAAQDVEILSTGGTAKTLTEAGIPVREVSDYTGFPEMMDGRVKTLHPRIHGGLLALRDNPAHTAAMEEQGITGIDLLVVNLYPFEETVAGGADAATIIENIDIGGPAMIRSAAKNHGFVTVVTDPGDYPALLAELKANDGATSLDLRRRMAARAYQRTASYDSAIAAWFAEAAGDSFPDKITLAGKKMLDLRYGENPHQQAAFYSTGGEHRLGVASATQLQGKELSFNNLNDTDAAFALVSELDSQWDGARAAVAIIKHANPCGVALGDNLAQAYRRALACDPLSAFGGIIAVNRALDAETAGEIVRVFTEVVIAPEVDDAAREILSTKKNLRLLVTGGMADPEAGGMNIRSLAGGLLVQTTDNGRVAPEELRVVTRKQPSAAEMADMELAFTICKHVKSNAIIYVKDGASVGIGAGQMSRIDSARIAASKARDAAEAAGLAEPATVGSVVASDAFFPFADGLLAAAKAGATAVIQPGGSMRDDEVIAAADEAGLAMVMTGMRHFRH